MGKRSKVKKYILKFVLFLIVSVVVGCSIYFVFTQNILGSAMPMPFGVGLSVVLSGSMEPELFTNDLVIIVRSEEYEVGDIVVYQSGNSLIIHRIIKIDGDTVVTKGDANNVADDPVSIEDIKGKMAGRVPYIGAVVCYVQESLWIKILLIAIAATLLILAYKKENNDEKLQEEADRKVLKEEIARLRKELSARSHESRSVDKKDSDGTSQ